MFPEWSQEISKNENKLEGKFWRFFPEFVLTDVEPFIRLKNANLNLESFTINGTSEDDILKKASYKIIDAERRHSEQDAAIDEIIANRRDKLQNNTR